MVLYLLSPRLSAVKRIPGIARAHFEPRRGSEAEASDYCKKEGDFEEFGIRALCKGSRTDVLAFAALVKSGRTDLELMEEDFNAFNRFYKTVDRYRSYIPPKRTEELKVALFVGKTGTGKTRKAYDLFPDLYAFPIGKDLWSDGYMGQKNVLVDDFSGQMRLVDLLRFLDRYPIQIPKKGGFNWWCPSFIIITTNFHPRDWFKWDGREEHQAALKRRFTTVFDFDNLDITEGNDPTQLELDDYWVIQQ